MHPRSSVPPRRGTNSPPGPAGARFYNFGYSTPATVGQPAQTTSAGDNFPSNAVEQRAVSLNHWNNPNPDAGGVATVGQLVFVPTSATLQIRLGWGSDEMQMAVIGGSTNPGSDTSQFRTDLNVYGMWEASFDPLTASGKANSVRNLINMNATVQVRNAGGGSYGLDGASAIPWGYLTGGDPSSATHGNIVNFFRDSINDQIVREGTYFGEPGKGIPENSTGHAFDKSYNVLSTILQDGSAFTVDFESQAELYLTRNFGDADARVSTGPGMQGQARLLIGYEIYLVVVPEPSRAVLLAGAFVILGLRRRR